MKLERLWRLSDWLGVLSYMVIIALLIQFWLSPPLYNAVTKLETLDLFFAFEFLMVHSGVFMAVCPRKITLTILLPFYGLFVWAMSAAVPGSGFAYAYLAIVFFRMRFAFSNPSNLETNINIGLSAFGVLNYFLGVMIAAVFAGVIPELGLTDAYLSQVGYKVDPGEAVLHSPHHFLGAMVVYFALFTCAELVALRVRRNHHRNGNKPVARFL